MSWHYFYMATQIITIFNQKGGVGKTSLAVLLADYLEKTNRKVLLIDLDPQMNLSETFSDFQNLENENSLYDFFCATCKFQELPFEVKDNVSLVASSKSLAQKSNEFGVEKLVKFLPEIQMILDEYEMVVIDAPPNVSSLSKLGLLLAKVVVIPFIPEVYGYEGIKDALNTVNEITPFNKHFDSVAVVANFVDKRKLNVQSNFFKLAEQELPDMLIPDKIPYLAAIKERASVYENFFTDKKLEKDPNIQIIWQIMQSLENRLKEK